jgi:hypothetical protein
VSVGADCAIGKQESGQRRAKTATREQAFLVPRAPATPCLKMKQRYRCTLDVVEMLVNSWVVHVIRQKLTFFQLLQHYRRNMNIGFIRSI